MAKLRFRRKRMIEAFQYLVDCYRDNVLDFGICFKPEAVNIPNFIIPGSLEHRQYLFFAAMATRYGQPSDLSFARLKKSIEEEHRLINPLADFNDVDFRGLLTGVLGFVSSENAPVQIVNQANYQNYTLDFDSPEIQIEQTLTGKPLGKQGLERITGWVHNLEMLRDEYDGDPGEIFIRAKRNRASFIQSLRRFKGFGDKVSQLAIAFFQDVDWLDNQNIWQEIKPIKVAVVDLWFLRMIRQWDLISKWSTDQHDALRIAVGNYVVDTLYEADINHIDFVISMWHLGARICRRRPTNPNKVAPYCLAHCPMDKYCSRVCTGSRYKIDGTLGYADAHQKVRYYIDQSSS